jgi:hypothetical protein
MTPVKSDRLTATLCQPLPDRPTVAPRSSAPTAVRSPSAPVSRSAPVFPSALIA